MNQIGDDTSGENYEFRFIVNSKYNGGSGDIFIGSSSIGAKHQ